MSLHDSFQLSLKEACLDCRECCGPLIITCSSLLLLICSAQCTHRWILMPWRMIAACARRLNTQTDADRRQKLEQHEHTITSAHTPACSLCVAKWDDWASSSSPWRKKKLGETHREKRTRRFLPWYFIAAAEGWKEKRISFKWNQ